MSPPFHGSVAIVVGAGGQVGRACALRLAELGAEVAAVDTDEAGAVETCRLAAACGPATSFVADIVDAAAMTEVAARCGERWDAVQVLVNAHMAVPWGTVEGSTVESWEQALRINLLGPVISTKVFLPLLKRAGGAAIVHIGSVDGILGNPHVPAYSASKGGLVPLTHVMANELGPFGIRVNCVARAALTAGAPSGAQPDPMPALMAVTPLGRPGLPAEVAAAVAFLASDEASYITGAVLPVDGGRIGITPGDIPRPARGGRCAGVRLVSLMLGAEDR